MNSSDRPDYHLCYRVLGLKAGCRWEQARYHYKLLSQRCHPDRFPEKSKARAAAEKKQRAINFAMRVISDYYRKYGRMPLPDRPKLRQPEPADIKVDLEESGKRASPDRGRGKGRWFLVLVILVQAFLLGWLWLERGETRLETGNSTVAAGTPFQSEVMNRKPLRFGFGDPPEVVRLVQGEPTAIKGNNWYYGRSIVYFKDGRVAGWMNHVDFPLRTDAEHSVSEHQVIRIGSTRNDVIRIQGEPLFKGESRWDYGPSYIEFQGDRVSGWHDSPLRPLRVEKQWK